MLIQIIKVPSCKRRIFQVEKKKNKCKNPRNPKSLLYLKSQDGQSLMKEGNGGGSWGHKCWMGVRSH